MHIASKSSKVPSSTEDTSPRWVVGICRIKNVAVSYNAYRNGIEEESQCKACHMIDPQPPRGPIILREQYQQNPSQLNKLHTTPLHK